MDIFERERSGEIISLDDPDYGKIADLITEAQKLIAEINTGYRTPQEVRDLFSQTYRLASRLIVLDAPTLLH